MASQAGDTIRLLNAIDKLKLDTNEKLQAFSSFISMMESNVTVIGKEMAGESVLARDLYTVEPGDQIPDVSALSTEDAQVVLARKRWKNAHPWAMFPKLQDPSTAYLQEQIDELRGSLRLTQTTVVNLEKGFHDAMKEILDSGTVINNLVNFMNQQNDFDRRVATDVTDLKQFDIFQEGIDVAEQIEKGVEAAYRWVPELGDVVASFQDMGTAIAEGAKIIARGTNIIDSIASLTNYIPQAGVAVQTLLSMNKQINKITGYDNNDWKSIIYQAMTMIGKSANAMKSHAKHEVLEEIRAYPHYVSYFTPLFGSEAGLIALNGFNYLPSFMQDWLKKHALMPAHGTIQVVYPVGELNRYVIIVDIGANVNFKNVWTILQTVKNVNKYASQVVYETRPNKTTPWSIVGNVQLDGSPLLPSATDLTQPGVMAFKSNSVRQPLDAAIAFTKCYEHFDTRKYHPLWNNCQDAISEMARFLVQGVIPSIWENECNAMVLLAIHDLTYSSISTVAGIPIARWHGGGEKGTHSDTWQYDYGDTVGGVNQHARAITLHDATIRNAHRARLQSVM